MVIALPTEKLYLCMRKKQIDYLRASHRYFLDFQLPSIRKKLEEALNQNDNLVVLIMRLYDEYAHDIRTIATQPASSMN